MISNNPFNEKFLADIFHKMHIRWGVAASIPFGAATQRYTLPGLNDGLILSA